MIMHYVIYVCEFLLVSLNVVCQCFVDCVDNKIQPNVASKLVADFKVCLTFSHVVEVFI